jgi:Lar family restriction alleviation protein
MEGLTTMSSELKACPFCGGETLEMDRDPITKSWFVSCYECPCEGISNLTTKQDAIHKWNTRQSPWIPISSGRLPEINSSGLYNVIRNDTLLGEVYRILTGDELKDRINAGVNDFIAYMPIEPYTQEDEKCAE